MCLVPILWPLLAYKTTFIAGPTLQASKHLAMPFTSNKHETESA